MKAVIDNEVLSVLEEIAYRAQIMYDYERKGEIETRWTDKQSISPAGEIATQYAMESALKRLQELRK